MTLRTRYRILFNGEQYKIQYQTFKITLFGHWKRKWVDLGVLYNSLTQAEKARKECIIADWNAKYNEKMKYKKKMAIKKNVWIVQRKDQKRGLS